MILTVRMTKAICVSSIQKNLSTCLLLENLPTVAQLQQKLVASDFFAVYKWEISGKADFEKTADYSLFSVLDGQGSLNVDGQDYDIAKGGHFILPSDVQAWEIEGNLELIVSHP